MPLLSRISPNADNLLLIPLSARINKQKMGKNKMEETEEFVNKDVGQELKQLKLDDLFRLGKYAALVSITAEFLILLQLGNMFYMMYAGVEPGLVSCGPVNLQNFTHRKDRCEAFAQAKDRYKCTPELNIQFNSVSSDWNYICADVRQVKRSISWQMLAIIPGAVIGGQLSDLYGRRRIMLVGILCVMVCQVLVYFSPDLLWFTIIRSITQLFNGGIIAIQMVFTVENLPKNHRFWLTNLITWSPNMIVYALMAWATQNWQHLTLLMAALCIPAWIFLFFLSESPRFLIQKHRFDDAKRELQRIARIDGVVVAEEMMERVVESERALQTQKKKSKYSFIHLFYTCRLARYTVALAFSLLTTSMLNYSLIFNMEKLSGSIYLNTIFMGLFRYGVNFAAIAADKNFKWLGRKAVHGFAEGVSILALVLLITLYVLDIQTQYRSLITVTIILVLGMTTLLYVSNGLLSSELFPTGIRNLSFSFGQVFSRIGVVIAPQLFFLADFWSPLPYITLVVIASLDFILFYFNTEETKGKPMPDSMPPREQSWLGRKKLDQELLDVEKKTENN
ncbi:unnamed protein product [Bursaphelenchus xylophilus]|uniref:(pine wood nematode) hypothetical protein n=1 Tax=Bursaphelenchus xylophilus TaxID=6326 RepID=A0A7I8X6D3_BURXY|nr:unnamed protein product [Bursaphelenchus xylophilus]CAG9122475.1 unnamed protein product [Bursaphelenchus xylophilus]